MKLGIVLSTNDPEEVWNAFRFANVSTRGKTMMLESSW